MKLVIAEKPSVAMSLAAVLGATERKDGYLEGSGYLVSWCVGHLLELAQPEAYKEQYAKWRYEDLPILPENWKYEVPKDKKTQLALLCRLMKDKRVDSVVWDIAQVLEKLAISYDKNKEKQGCYDVVIATNMIAVGMDVDRLGLMSVVGQPKQNSEYIQATSRVGRQHPGIIFTVYNPYRPRDLSNYENFVGFHSQMYRYVEGTTATPFAARARDRVLHALVVSLLRLQVETMADNGGAWTFPFPTCPC